MLDDYKVGQAKVYQDIVNSVVKNNKISHAYLIETTTFANGLGFGLSFAKVLLCKKHYTNSINCKNCKNCHLIDTGLFADFKLIEPDGQWIKKEQLLDLQQAYKTTSLENGCRVYIINHAEQLNKSAANSLLKFLEEPSVGIIAILICKSRYQLLDTLVSRCQIFQLYDTDQHVSETIDITSVFPFFEFIETRKTLAHAYLNQLWYSNFSTKEDYNSALSLLSIIYRESLNIKIGFSSWLDNDEKLKNIVLEMNIDDIIRKLNLLSSMQEELKYNVNLKLWLDKLVLKMTEG